MTVCGGRQTYIYGVYICARLLRGSRGQNLLPANTSLSDADRNSRANRNRAGFEERMKEDKPKPHSLLSKHNSLCRTRRMIQVNRFYFWEGIIYFACILCLNKTESVLKRTSVLERNWCKTLNPHIDLVALAADVRNQWNVSFDRNIILSLKNILQNNLVNITYFALQSKIECKLEFQIHYKSVNKVAMHLLGLLLQVYYFSSIKLPNLARASSWPPIVRLQQWHCGEPAFRTYLHKQTHF